MPSNPPGGETKPGSPKATKEDLELMLAVDANSRGDMAFVLQPQPELLRMNFDAATKFAEQAIKGTLLLNGGALIALSGYAALFKIDPFGNAVAIVATVLAFVIGLVASCVCSFFAYQSARFSMHVANHQVADTVLSHLKSTDKTQRAAATQERIASDQASYIRWSYQPNGVCYRCAPRRLDAYGSRTAGGVPMGP